MTHDESKKRSWRKETRQKELVCGAKRRGGITPSKTGGLLSGGKDQMGYRKKGKLFETGLLLDIVSRHSPGVTD